MANTHVGASTPQSAGSHHGLDLSRARQKRGITLLAVSERTKISVRYLEAIEAGRFGELPGGIFTLSYLRQYAEVCGYDVERLIGWYESQTQAKEAQAEVKREGRAGVERTFLHRLLAS